MKISFLAPHLRISGGVRIILMYAALLSRRGHDVTVYVRSNNSFRRRVANMFHLGYPKWIGDLHKVKIMRVPYFTDTNFSDAEVTVATTYRTALDIRDFPASKGRQFYLLQHDEGLYHGPRDEVDSAYRLAQKKIVVATWLKDLLKEKYQQDAELLINPVELSQFHKVSRTVKDGTIRILVLAHTYAWKGTKEAVDIVNRLKKSHPEVRLILYGVRTPEVEDYVCDEYHYNVPQAELKQLYSNSDIYLCPSWDEGFGLPSIEAMACGVAVATYDNGGSRDFAFHEKTALVAPRRDENALLRELERSVIDRELRIRIASEGRSFVSQMATWNEQTKKLEQIFSDSTAQRGA